MAKFTAESFTSNIVAISVGVVVFGAIALPMLSTVTTEDPALQAILTAIPVFIGVGLLMGVIYMFIQKGKN